MMVAANAVSYSDTTVAGSTTYYYRVYATNASGDSTASNIATVTTPASTVPAPAAPTSLAATASGTQVNLSWLDNATTETGYRIDRATNNTFTTNLVTVNAAANSISYSDTTVAGSTTYYYRVYATNSAGNSGASNTASVATPVQLVSYSATIQPMLNGSCSCHVTSTQSPRLNTYTNVYAARNNLPGMGASYLSAAQEQTLANWISQGALNDSAAVPAAPTSLTATAASASQVNLAWAHSGTTETGFRIQRATNNTFSANSVTMTVAANAVSYSDTTVSGSTTYYYRVYATNASGDSAASNTASVTTPAPTGTVPAAPTSLTATASGTQVNLTWLDNATTETGYRIDRATNNTFSAGLVTVNAAANAISYSDTTVAGGTTYYYRVYATNSAGNSAASSTASIATAVQPVSYSATIAPMLNQYCNSCHSSQSPRLNTYASVYSARNNLPGMGASYLSTAQEQTLANWISQGAPNN
jgi:titin